MFIWVILALGWLTVALIAISVFRLASLADRILRRKSRRQTMAFVGIEPPRQERGEDRAA